MLGIALRSLKQNALLEKNDCLNHLLLNGIIFYFE